MIFQPRLILAVMQAGIEPKIISGGRSRFRIEPSCQDIFFYLLQALADVVSLPWFLRLPKSNKRVIVSDAQVHLSKLPVSTHDHGGTARTIMLACVFAKACGAAADHRVPKGTGQKGLAAELHPRVSDRHPRPGEHLLYLSDTQPSPFSKHFESMLVLLEDRSERRTDIVGEVRNIRPPRCREAREV
jgi:hypothetical protein